MHSLSRFLPSDFAANQGITVIAGRGNYPIILIQALHQLQIPVRLIGFAEETKQELIDRFPTSERVIIKVGQLGKMLRWLDKFGLRYAIMAGQITPRKLFKGLHPDLKAIRILASLPERNAESIFGAIAKEMAQLGIEQLDARAFLDQHLAQPGLMSGKNWDVLPAHLEHGIHIAREIARLNIGQGVVVNRGTVLAVEAFEGTDEMLRRAGEFHARQPLFVKTVKPNQDYRFDVPVFGTTTLKIMQQAGLRHAALEADNVIILDRDQVFAQATQAGIRLYGFAPVNGVPENG